EGAGALRRKGAEAIALGAPDQRAAPGDGAEGATVGRRGDRIDGIVAQDPPGRGRCGAAGLARGEDGEAPVAVDDGERAAARRERERGHTPVLGAREGGERR